MIFPVASINNYPLTPCKPDFPVISAADTMEPLPTTLDKKECSMIFTPASSNISRATRSNISGSTLTAYGRFSGSMGSKFPCAVQPQAPPLGVKACDQLLPYPAYFTRFQWCRCGKKQAPLYSNTASAAFCRRGAVEDAPKG